METQSKKGGDPNSCTSWGGMFGVWTRLYLTLAPDWFPLVARLSSLTLHLIPSPLPLCSCQQLHPRTPANHGEPRNKTSKDRRQKSLGLRTKVSSYTFKLFQASCRRLWEPSKAEYWCQRTPILRIKPDYVVAKPLEQPWERKLGSGTEIL